MHDKLSLKLAHRMCKTFYKKATSMLSPVTVVLCGIRLTDEVDSVFI